MRKLLGRMLRKGGYQFNKYPNSDLARRIKIMNYCNINILFDIGANNGQYAKKLREIGYKGKIVSFEPLKSAFELLRKSSSNDNNWIINNYALGNEDTHSIINIAGNSQSSSILKMLPKHLKSAPESKYVSEEKIEIKKLDSVFSSFCNENENNIMLKIDTQGYEKNVIDGAEKFLSHVMIIQLEMSIVPLYESEMLYIDMIDYLNHKGFQLFSLENGFSDLVSGQLLQVDGIFVKKYQIND